MSELEYRFLNFQSFLLNECYLLGCNFDNKVDLIIKDGIIHKDNSEDNAEPEDLDVYLPLLANYRNLCAHEDILFENKTWDIKNEFFFMSKNEIMQLANENNFIEVGFVSSDAQTPNINTNWEMKSGVMHWNNAGNYSKLSKDPGDSEYIYMFN